MSAPFFERHPSLRALSHRDYRLLLAGSTLVSMVMPFQFLTQVFWVQDRYPGHGVFYTSLISASRGLAMLTFALVGGAIADRVERRKVLLVTESASFATNAVVAVLMITFPFGSATIVAVVCCTFLSAGVGSIDSPARSASIPAIVGMRDLTSGIALSSLASQLTLPLTLPWVGILNGAFDPGWVYGGSLMAWLGVIPLISMLRYRSVGGGRGSSMFANIVAGLGYARANAIIFGVLSVVVVVQLVGMPVATPLGPVFMIDVLGFSARQVGFMGMTWGLGAMSASLLFARLQGRVVRGIALCGVAMFFGITVLGFGYSRYIPLTAAFDYSMGFAFTSTNLVAGTLVQYTVAEEMRGRVMGLFPFTLGSAYVFTAPIGLLGQRVGLAVLLPLLGWATLVCCGAVIASRPQLLRARPVPPLAAGSRAAAVTTD